MPRIRGVQEDDPEEHIGTAPGEGDDGDGSDDSDAPVGKDAPDKWKQADQSCRGYRGHLSRRMKSARNLIQFGDANPSSAAATALLESKTALDLAYQRTCDAFQVLFDLNPPAPLFKQQQLKLDQVTEKYDDACAAILASISRIKRPPSTHVTSADWAGDDDDEDYSRGAGAPSGNKAKVNTALRPEKLTENFTPREFTEWAEQFKAYYITSNFNKCAVPVQQAYLRQCLNKTIWFRIGANVEEDTEIFGDASSCMSLLLDEFKERYPEFNRRLTFFRSEQQAGQSMTDYMIRNRQLHDEADMHEITQEQMLLFRNIAGCRDKKLRERLLELEIRTLSELTKFVTRWEVAKKEDKDIDKTNASKASQIKGRQQKSGKDGTKKKPGDPDWKCYRCGSRKHHYKDCTVPATVVCKYCDKTGHTVDACMSKQKGKKSGDTKEKQKALRAHQATTKPLKEKETPASHSSSEEDYKEEVNNKLQVFRVRMVKASLSDPTPRLNVLVRQGRHQF